MGRFHFLSLLALVATALRCAHASETDMQDGGVGQDPFATFFGGLQEDQPSDVFGHEDTMMNNIFSGSRPKSHSSHNEAHSSVSSRARGRSSAHAPTSSSRGASSSDAIGDMMKQVLHIDLPEPDMSVYSNSTPVPRWGTTASYMPNMEAIVFSGGQVDDSGSMTNETLVLDMSGLKNLQKTRASSKHTPWLLVREAHGSERVPGLAYASSTISTSNCASGPQDTFWLVGGKTEHCKTDDAVLYTLSLERRAGQLVGAWRSIQTKGPKPPRRAHARAIFPPNGFAGNGNASMVVIGGEDSDGKCHPSTMVKYQRQSTMDVWQLPKPYGTECIIGSDNKKNATSAKAEVNELRFKQSMLSLPVKDYTAVPMPIIPSHDKVIQPLLFLGGRDYQDKFVNFARPWAMDMGTGNWQLWETTGDVPSPRVGHSAVHTTDGRVYVFGGYKKTHGDSVSRNPTDELYELDASRTPARWTRIHYPSQPAEHHMPSPARAYHTALMVDDVLVIGFGQQHKSTAYGLQKRGGTSVNSTVPLVMYMDTRENVMQYRWTDRLSAVVSARVASDFLGMSTKKPTPATYRAPPSATHSASASSTFAHMVHVPNASERSASRVSKSSASAASKSRASAASAAMANASHAREQASASRAKAHASKAHKHHKQQDKNSSKHQGQGASKTDSSKSNAGAPAEQDGGNHAAAADNSQDGSSQAGSHSQASSSSSSSSSTPSSSSSADSQNSSANGDSSDHEQSSTRTGAIAGGVIGAAALAVGAVVGGLYAYRKRRESQQIAMLRANGVIDGGRRGDDPEAPPPVSSLWLQRPMKEVLNEPDMFGRQTNLSGYSMEGHPATPLSVSPVGGRSLGHEERHSVRGPRSVYPEMYAAEMPTPGYDYSAAHSYTMPSMQHTFEPERQASDAPSVGSHYSYPYLSGVQRSSGSEVTTHDLGAQEAAESVYSNSVGSRAAVHGDHDGYDDFGMRTAASFRFPETQTSSHPLSFPVPQRTPPSSTRSALRVTN